MIKKMLIFGLIGIFLLSGCEELKELYGIEPAGEEGYIPIEEIKIEEIEEIELPPTPPGEDMGEILEGEEELEIEDIEIVEEEELPEEIIEIIGEEPGEIIEIIEEELPEEEVVEEGPTEGAKVLIVKENDLISLKPKASDPDEDKLEFSYTAPLDEDGKWETTYGDAGEYTVTITASDGQLSATKDILIIVNKKEEPPIIDEALPIEEVLEANENSKLEFSVKASDLNKDTLIYVWKLDGNEASTEKSYTYDIGYDGAGQHTVKITVSDSVEEASKIWSVTVENVNRKPILDEIADIQVKETELIVLAPEATDLDEEDELTFSIDDDNFKEVDGNFEWETTYDDSGVYTVTITASDGKEEVSQTVKITVENVNRPPVIDDIILG